MRNKNRLPFLSSCSIEDQIPHLNLYDFSLNDFSLLHDSHTDGSERYPMVSRDDRERNDEGTHRRKACVRASVRLISSEKIWYPMF